MPIAHLPAQTQKEWTPAIKQGGVYTVKCVGSGPVVITLGDVRGESIVEAGFQACAVTIPTPPGIPYDELALAKSIGVGTVRAESVAGAVAAAATAKQAIAIWGHRSWGVVAGLTGLPFVVQDPIQSFDEVDIQVDLPWIHIPGAWNGGIDRVMANSLATGTDPNLLLAAISDKQN